jgi:hypothetical protein
MQLISLFHRAFQFTMCNGPTNALVCNKTSIQMSQLKHLKSLQHVVLFGEACLSTQDNMQNE